MTHEWNSQQPRLRYYTYNTITFDAFIPPFAINSWTTHAMNNAAGYVIASLVARQVMEIDKTRIFVK